jgi:FkbM family methyltransferase
MLDQLRAIGRQFAVHPLTRDSQFEAWLRFTMWQIKSRLREEVVVPWIGGQRLALRRGMTGATGDLYMGLHEFMSMGLILHFLRADELFIDGGANVGSYTVLASGICRARTMAVEADAETTTRLARNVELNRLENLVTICQVALGPVRGTVRFTKSLGTMNKVVGDSESAEAVPVQQKTLDCLIGDDHPVALKLDVEGYEEQVLRGAANVIQKPSLNLIELEEATPWTLAVLQRNGFKRAFYDPFSRSLTRTPNRLAYSDGKWTPSNTFYVRDWEFVQQRVASAKAVLILGHTI